MKNNSRFLMLLKSVILPVLLGNLLSCVVAGSGVVRSVETHYITSKKDILTVSGETAAHPLYGIFTVDVPVVAGKNYRNDENNATLTFTNDGICQQAFIKPDDGSQSAMFDYIIHGGPVSSTVIGIYW